MFRLLQEVRFAARTLVRSRLVSALAILAFALGIGVTTAVFSIFNSVLLTPLPYPDPDELVMVYDTQPACATCPASFPKYHDWKSATRSSPRSADRPGGVRADRLRRSQPCAGMSDDRVARDVFGVRPLMGRWYTRAEDQPGGPKVVVLSHDLWTPTSTAIRSSWAGRYVRRRAVRGDRRDAGELRAPHAPSFVPLQRKLDPATRGNHFLATYARLKPGVTARARHDRDARARADAGEGVRQQPRHRRPLVLRSGRRQHPRRRCGAARRRLPRAADRVRERREPAARVGPRAAARAGHPPGARRRPTRPRPPADEREPAPVVVGGAIGVLLATWVVRRSSSSPATCCRAPPPSRSTAACSCSRPSSRCRRRASAACGRSRLRPRDLAPRCAKATRAPAAPRGRRFGNGLVVAEIAIAFALLVGAGLLVKNLILLRGRDAGIRHRTDRGLRRRARRAALRGARAGRRVLPRAATSASKAVGGVETVGATSHLPMYRFGWNGELSIEGGNPWDANDAPLVEYRWIVRRLLQDDGHPLLKGRAARRRATARHDHGPHQPGDGGEVLARRGSARQALRPGPRHEQWYEVVGVVGDVRSYGLAPRTPYEFYRTIDQSPFRPMTVVIRTRGDDPTAIVPNGAPDRQRRSIRRCRSRTCRRWSTSWPNRSASRDCCRR